MINDKSSVLEVDESGESSNLVIDKSRLDRGHFRIEDLEFSSLSRSGIRPCLHMPRDHNSDRLHRPPASSPTFQQVPTLSFLSIHRYLIFAFSYQKLLE